MVDRISFSTSVFQATYEKRMHSITESTRYHIHLWFGGQNLGPRLHVQGNVNDYYYMVIKLLFLLLHGNWFS